MLNELQTSYLYSKMEERREKKTWNTRRKKDEEKVSFENYPLLWAEVKKISVSQADNRRNQRAPTSKGGLGKARWI